jgi:hypothetical protein
MERTYYNIINTNHMGSIVFKKYHSFWGKVLQKYHSFWGKTIRNCLLHGSIFLQLWFKKAPKSRIILQIEAKNTDLIDRHTIPLILGHSPSKIPLILGQNTTQSGAKYHSFWGKSKPQQTDIQLFIRTK